MKKDLRAFSSIALMFVVGTSTVLSLAQERKPSPDRVLIEKQRTEHGPDGHMPQGQDRVMIEREIMTQRPPDQGGRDFVFLAAEMSFGGKVVKGAPYSAEAVTESVQTLTDGNRIINKSAAAVYRDSEGRTRREQTLKSIGPFATGGEPPVTVFINDPVAGTSYTLDPRTQTARKTTSMRFEGRGQVSLANGEQYKVAVESALADAIRNMEVGTAIGVMSTRDRSARTESLGKQSIGGVEAEGTRTTVTIPAGEIGNERAIETISERWYSPELQVIVMTRHTDPRFGENTYQLTNINRNEPARELFEVPPGYTVKESSSVLLTEPVSGINGGVLNGKATSLPQPEYPAVAREAKATGAVVVQVTIDESGNVFSATPVSGHPLLRAAAVKAARQAKFQPTRLRGQPVKVNGVLTYNFIAH